MFSFRRAKPGILHALSGEFEEITHFPHAIAFGNGTEADAESGGEEMDACRLTHEGGKLAVEFRKVPVGLVRINGEVIHVPGVYPVADGEIVSLQVAGQPLLLLPAKRAAQACKQIDPSVWELEDGETGERIATAAPSEVINQCIADQRSIGSLAGLPRGVDACPFWISELAIAAEANTLMADSDNRADAPGPGVVDKSADMTCPVCWLGFDAGTMLAIASHDDLTDPVLGRDEHLRFEAATFDMDGHPLDPMGLPATGFACPHCRHRLPPGFHELPYHIFSLVGASQAGKSYYLSILIHQLQRTLFQKFNLAFRDQDPQANAILNEMKQRVFQSARPEDAYLVKTQLEGEMYVRLQRYGKAVALPRPFVFQLSAAEQAEKTAALIFYDNAGEHFQPQVRIEDSPGALHVAASSAIFFLFDPAPNPHFRALLKGYPDPQLTSSIPDGQDVIMAEMESRIKRIAHVAADRRIDTPLAVMIGKCDIWKHLIAWDTLLPTVVDGALDEAAVRHNSGIIREFMVKIEPSIVANAEALSSNVCYFALSSFGHSPRKLKSGDGATEYLAPDPAKIQPIGIETPTLWALHDVLPGFIPVR